MTVSQTKHARAYCNCYLLCGKGLILLQMLFFSLRLTVKQLTVCNVSSLELLQAKRYNYCIATQVADKELGVSTCTMLVCMTVPD